MLFWYLLVARAEIGGGCAFCLAAPGPVPVVAMPGLASRPLSACALTWVEAKADGRIGTASGVVYIFASFPGGGWSSASDPTVAAWPACPLSLAARAVIEFGART